jgi:FtsP/CotA-like multicopper oxidase with cupredoxin domain
MSDVRFLQALMLAICLSSAPNAAEAAQVTYALNIANGHVPDNRRLIRVKQNDVVKLEWSTDKPTTVHLHGYDIEQELKPGTVTPMTFTARATGRFTIEPHIGKTPSGGHAHGDVLVTIEVYP